MSIKTNSWIDKAIFYHIYPLGMTGAPDYNEGYKTTGNRIIKVLDWIPHFKDLGINAIYFGPIFESIAHGYDTSNYYETDKRLGTIDDFKKVFSELKKNGIRIILDGVFNHVGRGFWAFNDVQSNLQESEYKDWFVNVDFDKKSPAGDNFSYEMWEGNADLVKLNLKNKDVINHLLGAVSMWIDEFDIDGLRLDAADCVDMDFFKKLHTQRLKKNDFWLMGEIIHGDYNVWANKETLDSTTNYECWKGIYSSHNDKNYFEIAYSLKRQFGMDGIYKDLVLYNFLDNHDVNRIATLLKNKEDIFNAYTILFTMPGIPSIYYGSEWGILGEKVNGYLADKPVRPEINIYDMLGTKVELIDHIKKLIELRKNNEALMYGTYKEILVKNEQFVFAREYEEQTTLIALNISDKDYKLNITYNNKKYISEIPKHSSCIF